MYVVSRFKIFTSENKAKMCGSRTGISKRASKVFLFTVQGPIKGVLFKGVFSEKMRWAFVP